MDLIQFGLDLLDWCAPGYSANHLEQPQGCLPMKSFVLINIPHQCRLSFKVSTSPDASRGVSAADCGSQRGVRMDSDFRLLLFY